ncbi:MAG: 4Fe-4S dicluster domain-containing protein [Desulfopila sp.]
MKKYYLIIDVAKCWDCNNCFISCHDEHENNDWPGYTQPQPRHGHRWINVVRRERGQYPQVDVGYRPTPCMHCQDAPCVKVSAGAISCREDGIVLIDPHRAKGKKELVQSCPYGAIYWNDEQNTPQKCTLCAHLLDNGWAQPRCVQACFTGALQLQHLEEDELATLIREEQLEQLHPERGTRPNVYYKNLYRFDKCFVAGSAVVRNDGDVEDCLAGARALLYQNEQLVQETTTDAFGDFRFDQLTGNSGDYTVKVEFCDKTSEPVHFALTASLYLGTIQV